METSALDTKRINIVRRLLVIKDESLLQEVENLLNERTETLPWMGDYSPEMLQEAVLRSKEDILNGKTHTQEQLRARHPRI